MRRSIILGLFFLCIGFARALTVQIDYAYDDGFFSGNAAARAAVEKAAADLSAALTGSMGAVPTNVFEGSANGRTVNLDWSLFVADPTDPDNEDAEIEIPNFAGLFPSNTIRIYVGAAPLTGKLGEGGPAGAGYGITFVEDAADGPALVNAANASNTALTRGAGPTIGSLDQSVPGTTVELKFGSIAGRLSIDSNTAWHFDINTVPPPDKFDLYSVALHEIVHAIGFGASASWWEHVDMTEWTGEEVIALFGTGEGVLNVFNLEEQVDLAHIKSGTLSPRISDGLLQLAIMDPGLAEGVRKELTELDLAFLRDIGYLTVPEPGTIALAAMALLALGGLGLARRRA